MFGPVGASLLLLILFGLGLLALVLFAAWMAWMTYRPPRLPLARTPADVGLGFTEVAFPAADGGARLSGWAVPAPKQGEKPLTAVLCHQWGANKGFLVSLAKMYHEAGVHVLLFDLRNHGTSSKDHSLLRMSRRYTADVGGAIDFARNHPDFSGGKVLLHAFSFSTFPAVVAAADPRWRHEVAGVVLDSGPSPTTRENNERFFDSILIRRLPRALRLPGVRSLFRRLYVRFVLFLLGSDWPASYFRQVQGPLLFMAGERDEVAPPQSLSACAAMAGRGRVVTFEGAPHLSAVRTHKAEYRAALFGFLAELPGSGPR